MMSTDVIKELKELDAARDTHRPQPAAAAV
jgi:hypothetical protein